MVNNSRIAARQMLSRPARTDSAASRKTEKAQNSGAPSFQNVLKEKMTAPQTQKSGNMQTQHIQQPGSELHFSRHAQKRMASRNIEISTSDMERINQAVETARSKGAKDSLVLLNDLALVVSVKNNTVVTAVDEASIRENVFTNIDSAVIAR